MKECYTEKNFRDDSLQLISAVNSIVSTYQSQGYSLTLRQVYYQLVSRDIIQNNERSYKNLGNLINDARLAGLVDWDSIEDRTRTLHSNSHWSDPGSILNSAASSYRIDRWADQSFYLEVWVEKDALIDVIVQACSKLDVTCLSCRGYFSASSMYTAANRFKDQQRLGKDVVLLHLGDHDPSGIDMSRDIRDRLDLFGVHNLTFERLALNKKQIHQYNPPPNPTKVQDTRSSGYIRDHGYECWELDALEPRVLDELISKSVLAYRDDELYDAAQLSENDSRVKLSKLARNSRYILDNLDTLLK